jgi:hypothetical protein
MGNLSTHSNAIQSTQPQGVRLRVLPIKIGKSHSFPHHIMEHEQYFNIFSLYPFHLRKPPRLILGFSFPKKKGILIIRNE